jgi:hypothetical protein
MQRLSTDLPFTCVTCEVEIHGTPEFLAGMPFCCAGCAANGPCTCSYDLADVEQPEGADTAAAPELSDIGIVRDCIDIREPAVAAFGGARR